MSRILLTLAPDATATHCGARCPLMSDRDSGACVFGKAAGQDFARRDHERKEWRRVPECIEAERDAGRLLDVTPNDAAALPFHLHGPPFRDDDRAMGRLWAACATHAAKASDP